MCVCAYVETCKSVLQHEFGGSLCFLLYIVPNEETDPKPAQIISYMIRVFQLTYLFLKDVKVYIIVLEYTNTFLLIILFL